MKRKLNLTILNLIIAASLLQATPTLAAAAPTCPALGNPPSFAEVLRRVACKAGYIAPSDTKTINEVDVIGIIGQFITLALSFTGVIFVILIIYGGWLWGSARGNEEQVQEAEKLIRNAVLGIIVTFAAFTIARFVLDAVDFGAINQPL